MNPLQRKTATLAVASATLGAATIVVLFVVQSDPQPLWLWATFAVAFVGLEFSSVEVNDRLFVSSSIMVAFTAAIVFGRSSAVLAVTLIAAVAVLHPDDLRLRRWRQPAYNFGQLVISAALGCLVLLPFLPDGPLAVSDLPRVVGGAALAAVVYDWVNFRLVSLFVRVAYPERDLRPWSHMMGNHAALAVLGAYGSLLGAAYLMVGPIALPLMFVTFLVGHVGFATYSRMREAHEATVRGFVKAIEALDPYTKGHTERVATFSRMTAERLGFDAEELELLRWAALIHDVGKVGASPELIRRDGPLAPEERRGLIRSMREVERLLARVDFLAAAVAIVAAQHELSDDGSAGRAARILAAADAFDSMTSSRSYRSAVTQAQAFAGLRASSATYGDDVVEALIGAIEESGQIHGSPDTRSSEVVEKLVRERARRA
jgi:hypothetical protein